jgi:uncharacterized membrane protein (DUF106 family)
MEKKTSLLQFTMTYGLILGIGLIIFSLILYIAGIMPTNLKRILLIALVNLALMITFVSIGTRTYRDKLLGGAISYGNAFITGLLIVVFSAILTAFFSLIFTTIIDPEYMNKVFEATKNWTMDYMSNLGVPESQIDKSLERIEKQQANYTPIGNFFKGIYTSAIMGTIISLITSAFIKKTPNPVE